MMRAHFLLSTPNTDYLGSFKGPVFHCAYSGCTLEAGIVHFLDLLELFTSSSLLREKSQCQEPEHHCKEHGDSA